MSVSVALDKPRSFNREALILIGGGAVSGVLVTGLNFIAGSPVPQLAALTFGAVLGLIANLADHEAGTPMLRLILSILGGVAMALLWPLHAVAAAGVGGLFIGGAFTLKDGDNKWEKGGLWLMYGLWLAAAVFTTGALDKIFDVEVMANLFQGTTWGLFLGLAAGLKRLRFTRDPTMAEFKEAEAVLTGSEWEAVRQGRILYEQIGQELERVDAGGLAERAGEIARETSQALIALARRSYELHVASERISSRRLGQRVVQLDERISNTEDEQVVRELEATLDEMLEQVRVRKRLDVARARLEARQQRCFTALERLHLALVQASSSSTDDIGVHESIENLERLSDEIRWRNLSVDELVDDEGEEEIEVPSDTLIDELRADLEADESDEPAPDVDAAEATSNDVVEGDRTVLDSTSVEAEPEDSERDLTSSPPGADGTVSPREEEAHVQQHATSSNSTS